VIVSEYGVFFRPSGTLGPWGASREGEEGEFEGEVEWECWRKTH
jgi:hypothetical protein